MSGLPVVAIASGVGGGKSTLARELARALGEAHVLDFDDFEPFTARPLAETCAWMRDGADPARLRVPGLEDALRALKAGQAARNPATAAELRARGHVIFEAPFGRWHPDSGRHIDLLVWIDTPLDIALARKLRQLSSAFPGPEAAFRPWLREYLAAYLEGVEALLRLQHEKVRPGADLVLDGRADPGALARQVARRLAADGA